MTARLESYPELLVRLPVVVNNSVMIRGSRLIVPYQPSTDAAGTGAVEVSLRLTAPLEASLTAAVAPIQVEALAATLLDGFPAVGQDVVHGLIAELVARGVLITGLQPPSTETDALGYLLAQLEAVGATAVAPVAGLTRTLEAIHSELAKCAARPIGETSAARHDLVSRMHDVAVVRGHPLAIDLRLDDDVVLPDEVAREAERAVLVLARLSAAPFGTAAWKAHHQRFYERFGIGSMVPVLDVVADSGIGFPAGYPGSDTSQPRQAVSKRDEALVRLAQSAALDCLDEVVLDERLLASLELGPDPIRLPPHLEIGVRVQAPSAEALDRGEFWLEVVSVSRGAGVGIGRFLRVLDQGSGEALSGEIADLPCADDNTRSAQLSFQPLVPGTAHVARSPQVLPTLISLGEHRAPAENVLTLQDLAVGCDGRRMYLAAPEHGWRLEAVGMHGIAGVLSFVSLATRLGIIVRGQQDAIRLICAWLDQWRTDGLGWPYWVTRADLQSGHVAPGGPQRPSWCYGAAGLARAQQLAAIALRDTQRQVMAEDALVRALTDPAQLAATTDASLCHGFAGLAHVVARCAADALPPASRQLQSLATVLLESVHPAGADPEDTVAALLTHVGCGPGFLDGTAGIALAVLAPATGIQPCSGWDACLLIT